MLWRLSACGLRTRAPKVKPCRVRAPSKPSGATVAAALAEGAVLAVVPLLLDAGRPAKANLSVDAGLLEAIDEAAEAHGLTRSAFIASAAREKITRDA
jgi:Ribbon-helix-helix protein, copG family